jgi:hypothetical protein
MAMTATKAAEIRNPIFQLFMPFLRAFFAWKSALNA